MAYETFFDTSVYTHLTKEFFFNLYRNNFAPKYSLKEILDNAFSNFSFYLTSHSVISLQGCWEQHIETILWTYLSMNRICQNFCSLYCHQLLPHHFIGIVHFLCSIGNCLSILARILLVLCSFLSIMMFSEQFNERNVGGWGNTWCVYVPCSHQSIYWLIWIR